MLEVIILLISFGVVFYNKGLLFGLGFLVIGWFVVGNIIKAIFKTDEAGFFPFAIADSLPTTNIFALGFPQPIRFSFVVISRFSNSLG